MRGILLLAVLTVKSSYSQNIETPFKGAGDVPDTLQWWFGDRGCWRIRTYALDHDIHTHQVAKSLQTTLDLEMAKKNNHDNYGDIIGNQNQIHFANSADAAERKAEFERIGLVPRIETADQFVFWKPDDAAYWTKSSPRSGG